MDTVVNLRFSNCLAALKIFGTKGTLWGGEFCGPISWLSTLPRSSLQRTFRLRVQQHFLKRQTVYHKLIMSVIISLFAALLVGINLIFSRLPNDYQCFKINQLNCVLHSLVIISAAVT